jgi:hypothetical protein
MTRVAACESTEKYLLDIALHSTAAHVEKLVRYLRSAQEAEEVTREAQQQANRYLSYQWDADGSLTVKASLPAEAGALFLKSLQAATKEIPLADIDDEKSKVQRPHSQRRADALTVMAESFMKEGASALTGADRQLIHVHVSAETLRDKTAGCCEFEDGVGVSAETSRRLACDASIVAIVENENGDPLNVGRKTRTISPALRRALNARDKGCRFPGCSNTKYVDAHHVRHWANGGETKPSNLVTLCRFHHRTVHEGGVRIEVLDDGAFRFVKLDGTSLVGSAPADSSAWDWKQLPAQHLDAGIEINKKTAATRWAGERMDYGLAVEVLLHMERNAKRATLNAGSST